MKWNKSPVKAIIYQWRKYGKNRVWKRFLQFHTPRNLLVALNFDKKYTMKWNPQAGLLVFPGFYLLLTGTYCMYVVDLTIEARKGKHNMFRWNDSDEWISL